MTSLVINVVFMVVISGWLSFSLSKYHFLSSLLSLEMVGIGVYFSGVLFIILSGGEPLFMIYYLVMLVGEGALGLSLLVAVSYSYGSDYLSTMNMLVC